MFVVKTSLLILYREIISVHCGITRNAYICYVGDFLIISTRYVQLPFGFKRIIILYTQEDVVMVCFANECD
jgi:hypothetical protein